MYIYTYFENLLFHLHLLFFQRRLTTMNISNINSNRAISLYTKSSRNKMFISNYLLECFLNGKIDKVIDIVENLENAADDDNINGDLQLEKKDDDIKASLFWLAILFFDKIDNPSSFILKLIQRGNCDVNSLGTYKSRQLYNATPLHVACSSKYVEAIDILLEYNADVNIPDQYGLTPLMITSLRNNSSDDCIDIAKRLINATDILLNLQHNTSGDTALHYAITLRRYKYAEYLVSRGANPFIKNNDKMNALMDFAITLATDNDEDHLHRVDIWTSFINEIKKIYINIDYDLIIFYDLLGASYTPNNVMIQKCIWHSSILLSNNFEKNIEEEEEDKKFLDVVGHDKYEFKTDEDLWNIKCEADCLIQCVFICQRILRPNHILTRKPLKMLLRRYIHGDISKSIKLLRYISEYCYKNDDDVNMCEQISFLNKVIKYFNFNIIFEMVTNSFFSKFMKRRTKIIANENIKDENIHLQAHNDTIYTLSQVIYNLYKKCEKNDKSLNKLRDFIDIEILPANLETFKLYHNDERYSMYDIFKSLKCNESFFKFLAS